MSAEAPRLAITMGDPCGVGPEIVVKALAERRDDGTLRAVVVGDLAHLQRTAAACGLALPLVAVAAGEWPDDAIGVIDLENVADDLPIGQAVAAGGEAAWQNVRTGVDVCLAGDADLLVTAPINKYALELAGRGHDGHTELLMQMCSVEWTITVFLLERMKVAFYSRHLSLRDAIDAIKADLVCRQLERFASAAPVLGLRDPVVAVAGLNPHCGENGLFGREELDDIAPGIALARERGLKVEGPIPADSVFHQHRTGRYDAILSLYHDQVSAVLKGIDFHGVVSVTLGLPFIRLSVDHGTALDIAGQNRADHSNMRATLDRALAWPVPAAAGDAA
jgi:4-hydroxythreonine-4-phosphate dehydrogenase